SVVDYVKLQKLRYELVTGLYMLEPWEKSLFNSVLAGFVSITCYGAYSYLPEY
ncbi:hypothetical protein GQ42DRAFT_106075, partial [Ramicandelaber brevisporus]